MSRRRKLETAKPETGDSDIVCNDTGDNNNFNYTNDSIDDIDDDIVGCPQTCAPALATVVRRTGHAPDVTTTVLRAV